MSEHVDLDRVRAGLRMAHPPDPERLAREKHELAELEYAPLGKRLRYYAKLSGPGFMQSAMTLGSGSAASALFAGAAFGYSLLWVAPVAMLFGVILLAAVAHQTLSTGMRPFEAMRRYAGAPFAWLWAIGALVASIIWHLPQYNLAASSLVDLSAELGIGDWSPVAASFVVLAWAIGISWFYGVSPRAVRIYERLLKYIVWGVVLCFGIVVWNTGIRDVSELLAGFFAFEIPGERNGVHGGEIALAGLAAAVGINMVFLYPYSLLARGWGREHRSLAWFDLVTSMWLPYVLAVSLMVIATANTIHLDPSFAAKGLAPIAAATALSTSIGDTGTILFLLGMLGMTLSTITLHMIATGFVCSELFEWPVGGWKHRMATWLPAPGVLAPIFWGQQAYWIAVPTTIICGAFLPLAYIAFVRLLGSRDYLGDDAVRGVRGFVWRGAILLLTGVLVASLGWYLWKKFLSA